MGNQKARQAAVAGGDDVQTNFWKLLNNDNFGFDCRNKSQNKSLHLIYDEDEEVDFISKYSKHDSDNCFLDLDSQVNNINRYYDNEENFDESKIQYVERLREEKVPRAKERFSKKKNGERGNKLLGQTQHLEEAYSYKPYTFVQDLEEEGVNSFQRFACKKQLSVKVSWRYISSKLLINAKTSLASFIYDCIDTFCFPQIIKVFPYLLMTDTDSGSLEFMVIAEDCCDVGEREMRDILIKIFLDNDIHHMLDLSVEFFEQFGKRKEAIQKLVGLYEFENIEQGIICTICVNPKEYFELYGIYYETNKKHKCILQGAKGMDFNNYAGRILTIEEAQDGTKSFAKIQRQTRFQNKKGNMIMVTIKKLEFAQLNDKRCILPDGINSLSFDICRKF